MNEIQLIFKTKENLREAVELCVNDLGMWFKMQPDKIQADILKVIGKYHNKKSEEE